MRLGLSTKITQPVLRGGAEAGDVPAEDITITISADNSQAIERLNSDGNYYNIIFPDDYIGTRGGGEDPFSSVRTGTGPIDYAGNLNVVFNIPADMSIGGNTSGNYGEKLQTVGAFADARYELRTNWVTACTNPTFGQYLSDPTLVINLDTDEWDSSILTRLNITINNYGNTIGAGGSAGYGGAVSSGGTKYHGGGGGGGGQGLHPDWPAGTENEALDDFSDGEWVAGQGGMGFRFGTVGGWGANGVQGTIEGGGAAGLGTAASTNQAGNPGHGHGGGTAIYVKSDVGSATSGTTINIVNKSTGRMYGGGGGGGGGRSGAGGAGGNMTTGSSTNYGTNGGGTNPGKAGWQGNILWVDAATNLTVANTITNDSSTPIAGWDGIWTT